MFRGPFCPTGIKFGLKNTFTGISELLSENDMKYRPHSFLVGSKTHDIDAKIGFFKVCVYL